MDTSVDHQSMAELKTMLVADCSLWPQRVGQDDRFGYTLAPVVSSVDEAIVYLDSIETQAATPALIVADLHLPGGGAAELCRQVSVEVPVLVLTDEHGQMAVLDAIAEGACGYLVRATDVDSTQTKMARAIIGEPVISSSLAGMILSHFRSVDDEDPWRLTPTERQIVQLTARNYGLGELADIVQMTVADVEESIRVLYRKLQTSRRAALAV